VRKWLEHLALVWEQAGYHQGPAFCDPKGSLLESQVIEGALAEWLQRVKESRPGVIPNDVDCYEHFGISSSFRRGATSTARTRGVDDKHVEMINRWRNFEVLLPEMLKFLEAL
jgi:hypothetical protein